MLMGEYENALKCEYESLNIVKRVYSYNPMHKRIAQALNDVGVAYMKNCQYDKAIGNLREALEIRNRLYYDKPNELVIESMNNLSDAYFKKADSFRQEEYAVAALEKAERYLKSDHAEFAKALNNLGNMYFMKVEI